MDFSGLDAYSLKMERDLPDIGSKGYLLEHKKSGARVMLIENEDDNKVFNIAFRTTPADSTGVAHIIEHTVLCGSRKYPSKDPFVELVKGSMNTFLNAMTFPDKTMFPAASTNDQDFKNLMDVYLDAVFYPNIYRNENIFLQEGWNYQIEDPKDEIVYNGVVYNEMKGAFSSPDDVNERMILNSLFPDTTYGVESGGDPEHIPDLTYEQFLNFHRTYYSPANSYIYLYGNMDFEERLEYLDREYLSHFDRTDVHSEIRLQKPFDRPREIHAQYPVGAKDPLEDNTYLSWNTVIGESGDTRTANALAALEYVLLDAPGAPLKKALLDAGIGKDVYGSYDSSIRQPVFSIVAKNANAADEEKFRSIIEQTLRKIAQEGLNPKEIEASVNSMEFRYREADFGGYPKGLFYSIDSFDSWLYHDDQPFDYLVQLDDYKFLRDRIGTDYYEKLITEKILGNPHTSFVVLEPSRGLAAETEKKTAEKLAAFKASLTEDQIRRLVDRTASLRAFQETPSTQEELEKIPMLTREDLGKDARPFDNHLYEMEGVRLVHHDYQTNGIAYITVLFDLAGIAQEDLPCLGILKTVLGEVDTANYSYRDLSTEIGRRTGGISVGVSTFARTDTTKSMKAALGVQIATLPDEIDFSMDIAAEILLTSRIDDRKRVREIIRKLKSRTYASLCAAGHATTVHRALSYVTADEAFTDGISGIGFYQTVADIEENFDERWDALAAKMRKVLNLVLKRERMLISFTGEKAAVSRVLEDGVKIAEEVGRGSLNGAETKLSAAAEDASGAGADAECTADAGRASGAAQADGIRETVMSVQDGTGLLCDVDSFTPDLKQEGFQTPAKIQFVSLGGTFPAGDYTGALSILKVIMSYDYLWTNLRVVGGAYGCGASFGRNGTAVFYSYRDPHLKNTIDVYRKVPEYLETFHVEERDMTKFVIGTISDFDTPLTPRMAGARSMNALISGRTLEQAQEERDQVLCADEADIRALAHLMRQALNQGAMCVLGAEDKLSHEKELFKTVKPL